jgi:hypothetical protein
MPTACMGCLWPVDVRTTHSTPGVVARSTAHAAFQATEPKSSTQCCFSAVQVLLVPSQCHEHVVRGAWWLYLHLHLHLYLYWLVT